MRLNEISIELTQRCPNRCIYCSSMSSPEATTELGAERVISSIDEAAELGAKTVCLSGGEPFLHSDFLQIVDHAYLRKLQIYIYTSGIIYDKGEPVSIPTDVLARIKGKVAKLIVNIEAADEALYDQIMGTHFGGLELLHRSVQNARKLGITVEAHMVPMNINVGQIPDVISLCREWGISRISFLRLVLQGRAMENVHLTKLDKMEHVITQHEIAEYREIAPGSIRIGIPFRSCSERVNCLTGTTKLNIRYDGNVYPCEAFKNGLPHGLTASEPDNIYRLGLKEIYNHSEYLKEIRQLIAEFQSVETCETCMNQYYRNNH